MPTSPILTRDAWGFVGPLGRELELPVDDVWLHHTVTSPSDNPAADAQRLEEIGKQRFKHANPPRLSYSFMVHPGAILYGQGEHLGIHTAGHNFTSLGVAAIGDYQNNRPGKHLISSLADTLVLISRLGWGPGQFSGGHRDTKKTWCPGDYLYEAIPDINALAVERLKGQPVPEKPIIGVAAEPVAIAWHPSGKGYTILTRGGEVINLGDPPPPYHGRVRRKG